MCKQDAFLISFAEEFRQTHTKDKYTHLFRRHVTDLGLEPLEALGGPLQALQRGHGPLGRLLAVEGGVAVRLDAVHPEAAFEHGGARLVFQELVGRVRGVRF